MKRSLRNRIAGVAIVGATAIAAAASFGVGVAAADPVPGAPHFPVQNASEIIRGSGSDTTFFMMQQIGDIYTAAGLYGCQLVSAAGQNMFGGGTSATTNVNDQCQAGADISTTDDADNWNRVEVLEGVNSVGSGAGQNQLCGSANTPNTVNFARSSKPSSGITGCNEQELGYAKDGVPIVDFPSINPSTYGTSSFTTAQVASLARPATAYHTINAGVVGPVAAGWLPGDNPSGSANHGTKLANITNTGAVNTSVAYRLWCVSGGNQITDWGQLTNLGPNLEVNVDVTSGQPTITVDASSGGGTFPTGIVASDVVTDPFSAPAGTPFASGTTVVSGSGTGTLTLSSNSNVTGEYTLTFAVGGAKLATGAGEPIGIPIRIVGVNTASGTTFTFANFAEGQTPGTACALGSGGNLSDNNAANDPLASTAPAGDAAHIALENNAHQLELFSKADFGASDTVDQAIEEATSLYFMSNGVYQTNPYVGETTIGTTSYAANLIAENSQFSGATTELSNAYPTSRTLSNIINSSTVSPGTAGFMNWICDSNANFTKGTDLSSGNNYDDELNTIISTTFGFPRLTDLTGPVATNPPADNVTAPNDDCVAEIPVTATGSSTVTIVGGGNFPNDVIKATDYSSANQAAGAGTVTGPAGASIPAATTVTSEGAGSHTITLSNPVASGTWTLEFFGVPAVLNQ